MIHCITFIIFCLLCKRSHAKFKWNIWDFQNFQIWLLYLLGTSFITFCFRKFRRWWLYFLLWLVFSQILINLKVLLKAASRLRLCTLKTDGSFSVTKARNGFKRLLFSFHEHAHKNTNVIMKFSVLPHVIFFPTEWNPIGIFSNLLNLKLCVKLPLVTA